METFSALLAFCARNSPVPGEFHAQKPVTRSFDVFYDLRLNKCLSKQLWSWWFEMLSYPLWRHCNGWITVSGCHASEVLYGLTFDVQYLHIYIYVSDVSFVIKVTVGFEIYSCMQMACPLWIYFMRILTHTQLKLHKCIFNTVATDALVLKHQAFSTHSAD